MAVKCWSSGTKLSRIVNQRIYLHKKNKGRRPHWGATALAK
jgi:hypothetical protein